MYLQNSGDSAVSEDGFSDPAISIHDDRLMNSQLYFPSTKAGTLCWDPALSSTELTH